MKLTQDYVRSILNYCPKTGNFHWRYRPDRNQAWNTRCAGKPTGTIGWAGKNKKKYILLRIDDVLHKAHRVAWLYIYGEMPLFIDHRDGDGINNAIDNLRNATRSQNQCNRGVQSNNTSGFKGVSYNKRLSKWHAYIKLENKRRHIGFYESVAAAKEAYSSAALKYHGEFARVA